VGSERGLLAGLWLSQVRAAGS